MGIGIKKLANINKNSIELRCKSKLIELRDGSKFIRLRRSEKDVYADFTY